MALYAGVALVITGMVNYSEIDLYAPLSVAFGSLGWEWAQVIISIGAFFVRSLPRLLFGSSLLLAGALDEHPEFAPGNASHLFRHGAGRPADSTVQVHSSKV